MTTVIHPCIGVSCRPRPSTTLSFYFVLMVTPLTIYYIYTDIFHLFDKSYVAHSYKTTYHLNNAGACMGTPFIRLLFFLICLIGVCFIILFHAL